MGFARPLFRSVDHHPQHTCNKATAHIEGVVKFRLRPIVPSHPSACLLFFILDPFVIWQICPGFLYYFISLANRTSNIMRRRLTYTIDYRAQSLR